MNWRILSVTCALTCALMLGSCSRYPDHDNPLDPWSENYSPPLWYDGFAYSTGSGDSASVTTELVPRAGAPEIEAVWVKLCTDDADQNFVPLSYNEMEEVWISSTPSKLARHNPPPGGGSSPDLPVASVNSATPAATPPCWFIVCDTNCRHYLVGPITVRGEEQRQTAALGASPSR